MWAVSSVLFFLGIITICQSNDKGLIIIPGLGRIDRLDTVLHNLNIIYSNKTISNKWDCVVYIYASRNQGEFWSQREKINKLYSYCSVIEVPGKRVTYNLYMAQPALLRNSYSLVFILLDDCRIISDDFSSERFETIMKWNQLTMASAKISGANKGGGQKFRNIMQTDAIPGTEGYISIFIEFFAVMFTFPAYEAFWELLFPFINPYGWGYDFWYDGYAKIKVQNHKMGILSNFEILHDQGVSINDRTDNTDIKDKWNAVITQEKHYLRYKDVNLAKIRNNIDLSNSSWNGAVKGFLMKPL